MGDQLATNYHVVTPDGRVTAHFAGSVQLDARTATVPTTIRTRPGGVRADEVAGGGSLVVPSNAIEWVTERGAAVAQLAGVTIPADSALLANARSQDGATVAQLAAIAGDGNSAQLLAQTYQDAELTQTVKLIDQAGDSSFVQGRGLRLNGGQGQALFVSSTSTPASIGHGLGRVPRSVVALPLAGGPILTSVQILCMSVDSSSIEFTMALDPGIGPVTGTFNFFWLAIG